MFLRVTALAFGLAELLAPRRVVDFWMALATDDDGEPRSWIYTAARIEGVLLVLWALTRGRSDGS
ncbi:hypothetical protein [Halobellus rubicundus]|uniref:Uncharacterized protein n=1 Tax=Halobellus rubicundus TaxID=2996466 RepID=A0ABD5MIG6_9EURY